MDPGVAVYHNNRANVLMIKDDLDGAIAEYSMAIEIDGDQAEIYLNRGHARLLMGRTAEAETDFAQSLKTAGARRPMFEQLIREYKEATVAQKR